MATDPPMGALLQVDTVQDRPDALASHFDLLSDGSRLQIIAALYRATEQRPTEAVPFSALFDQTTITDTGRFNYHLRRLCGPFVEKTADGYRLTRAGVLVGEVLAEEGTPATEQAVPSSSD